MVRMWNILVGLDQFCQTLIYLGKYNPDITISDVIGRKIRRNKANIVEKSVCWLLRKLQHKHCLKSYEESEKM